MVSYIQVEGYGLKQGFKGVEKPASGRPKAQSLQQEDDYFFYEYDSRGGLKSKRSKSSIEQYHDWFRHHVKFENTSQGTKRITPLTEFEIGMGVTSGIPSYHYEWCIRPRYGCRKQNFTRQEWDVFKQKVAQKQVEHYGDEIDHGELSIIYKPDIPKSTGQGGYDWKTYFTEKAEKQGLMVHDINALHFITKQKPAVVEKVRPNPKEKSIASVKIEKPQPVEIEPIKEAVKYSPLMIAGILVVIILFLKRRA